MNSITIERTYKASLSDVWALWTTKDGFESWWGPEGFRVDVHRLDARIGGELHYAMIADAPEMVEAMKQMGRPASHETHGTYTELRPHERLVLTHIIDFLPGVTPYESTIVAEFSAIGDRVRMVVTLHPMHDEAFSRMQVEGFTSQLTKLDKRFTTGSANDRRIDYIEMNVANIERSKAFYGQAFGWTFKDYGPDYCEFRDGRLTGGFTTQGRPSPGGPLIVLYADDLVAMQRQVETAGGRIAKPMFDFPGGQRFHFLDPDGYELAVWSKT